MSDTKFPDDSTQINHIAQIHPPKYGFATFESKWRNTWEETETLPGRSTQRPQTLLQPDDVSLPFSRRTARGKHVRLCWFRRTRSMDGNARI